LTIESILDSFTTRLLKKIARHRIAETGFNVTSESYINILNTFGIYIEDKNTWKHSEYRYWTTKLLNLVYEQLTPDNIKDFLLRSSDFEMTEDCDGNHLVKLSLGLHFPLDVD
jgi:hypothetical protein